MSLVLSVLIIDDDHLVLNAAAAGLQKAGYQVETSSDARSGLRLLLERKFDLLITDILMPDMDGFELIRAAQAAQPGLPILAQSSCNLELGTDTLRIASIFGAGVVLEKPYSTDELLEAVSRALAPSKQNHD